jgi:hypothetical protein
MIFGFLEIEKLLQLFDLFGGAGGAIVALRRRFVEPPSRHPLYLSGERMVEIP